MRTIEITRAPVELYKILKFEGLVNSGGEAKLLIDDGQVTVNGAVESMVRMLGVRRAYNVYNDGRASPE